MSLKRLSRDPIETQLHSGPLRNYLRSINRIAFSADGTLLAVGDLAGYLDTWVLQGSEDLAEKAHEDMTLVLPSAGSDDESADEGIHLKPIPGQHWIRNPAGSLIPRLPGTALVLSFRPQYPMKTIGNKGVDPKETGFRSYPLKLPDGEDRLFVFTSEHQMHEFHVLSGKLSNWSRRNPSSILPGKFQDLRDRAMGCVWDINGVKERIWLYGSSWLWMFDLSTDLPADAKTRSQAADDNILSTVHATQNLKRKRSLGGFSVAEVKKRDTGAGGKIPESELHVGIGHRFRRTVGPGTDNGRWISSAGPVIPPASHDADDADADADVTDTEGGDDENVANESALFGLRRRSAETPRITNGSIEGHIATDGEASSTIQRGPHNIRSYWGTQRYGDILGIVPLGEGVENGHNIQSGVEVALVERPRWEVDLPPRYHGNQGWD